jgi:hypothetical protein
VGANRCFLRPVPRNNQQHNLPVAEYRPILWAYINGPSNNGKGLASHPGEKLNLIVEMIPETNAPGFNNNIPSYVFQTSTYGTWCSGCAAQDVVTCSDWPGDKSAPTCNPSLPIQLRPYVPAHRRASGIPQIVTLRAEVVASPGRTRISADIRCSTKLRL